MRPLGYVLIVFNLLAAGAFLYFGVQDWKGRQETNAAVLKHILMLRGVPFEGDEETTTDPEGKVNFHVDMTAGNTVTTVGPLFLENYFKDAPVGDSKSIFMAPTPVPSQLGELKRVRNKVKEAFDAAATPQQKTRLLQVLLELGVESYTERIVVQRAVDRSDWQLLSLFLDMRFQQVYPKLLEGASGPLASDQWDKLPARIEALEAALKNAQAEYKAADDDARKAEADLKKPQADLLAEDAKLRAAQLLLERAKKEADAALVKEAEAEIAKQSPLVKRASDAAAPLLFVASDRVRIAGEKRRKVDEVATELAMLRRPAVPDEAGRRARLTHLLVHLDPDAAWQKRVMLVVGLRQYVKAIAAQAGNYRRMVDEVDYLIRRDEEAYTTVMAGHRDTAIQRKKMLMEVTANRERQTEQRDKDKALVGQRETQLAELETQLAKIKSDVAALLAEQTSLEQELFTLQREIAVTLDEVYALQDELREAEKARFTAPKP